MPYQFQVFDLSLNERRRLWKWCVRTATGTVVAQGAERSRRAANYQAASPLFLLLRSAAYQSSMGPNDPARQDHARSGNRGLRLTNEKSYGIRPRQSAWRGWILNAKSGAGARPAWRPRFQARWHYKSTGAPRRAPRPVIILFRQIQQAPFRELIGFFSKGCGSGRPALSKMNCP
jgi:hypothetical protein